MSEHDSILAVLLAILAAITGFNLFVVRYFCRLQDWWSAAMAGFHMLWSAAAIAATIWRRFL